MFKFKLVIAILCLGLANVVMATNSTLIINNIPGKSVAIKYQICLVNAPSCVTSVLDAEITKDPLEIPLETMQYVRIPNAVMSNAAGKIIAKSFYNKQCIATSDKIIVFSNFRTNRIACQVLPA